MSTQQPASKAHEHNGHGRHGGHDSDHNGDHKGHHAQMMHYFKHRFFICLLLTLPMVALSSMLQSIIGFCKAVSFAGDIYLLFVLSTGIFFYGGWPFLTFIAIGAGAITLTVWLALAGNRVRLRPGALGHGHGHHLPPCPWPGRSSRGGGPLSPWPPTTAFSSATAPRSSWRGTLRDSGARLIAAGVYSSCFQTSSSGEAL